MVIGVPNVGKSSLINAIRRTNLKKGKLCIFDICNCLCIFIILKLKNEMDAPFLNLGKASRVGGEPGITKAVLTKIQVF